MNTFYSESLPLPYKKLLLDSESHIPCIDHWKKAFSNRKQDALSWIAFIFKMQPHPLKHIFIEKWISHSIPFLCEIMNSKPGMKDNLFHYLFTYRDETRLTKIYPTLNESDIVQIIRSPPVVGLFWTDGTWECPILPSDLRELITSMIWKQTWKELLSFQDIPSSSSTSTHFDLSAIFWICLIRMLQKPIKLDPQVFYQNKLIYLYIFFIHLLSTELIGPNLMSSFDEFQLYKLEECGLILNHTALEHQDTIQNITNPSRWWENIKVRLIFYLLQELTNYHQWLLENIKGNNNHRTDTDRMDYNDPIIVQLMDVQEFINSIIEQKSIATMFRWHLQDTDSWVMRDTSCHYLSCLLWVQNDYMNEDYNTLRWNAFDVISKILESNYKTDNLSTDFYQECIYWIPYIYEWIQQSDHYRLDQYHLTILSRYLVFIYQKMSIHNLHIQMYKNAYVSIFLLIQNIKSLLTNEFILTKVVFECIELLKAWDCHHEKLTQIYSFQNVSQEDHVLRIKYYHEFIQYTIELAPWVLLTSDIYKIIVQNNAPISGLALLLYDHLYFLLSIGRKLNLIQNIEKALLHEMDDVNLFKGIPDLTSNSIESHHQWLISLFSHMTFKILHDIALFYNNKIFYPLLIYVLNRNYWKDISYLDDCVIIIQHCQKKLKMSQESIQILSHLINKLHHLIHTPNTNLEIPDEFIDPITFECMNDPIILPNMTIRMDRDVLVKVLLSSGQNPFTRQRMHISDCLPDTSLKQKINIWLDHVNGI